MTKSKAYYQAYLVLECLSEEEYSLIPQELLNEIESKMEVDTSIVVDASIPLEKQKIDEKTYDILDRVIRAIEKAYGEDAIDNPEKYANAEEDKNTVPKDEFDIIIDDLTDGKPEHTVKSESKKATAGGDKELKEENIRLKNIITALEQEAKKVEAAKALYYDYKEMVQKKDEIIRALQIENQNLKTNNEELNKSINSVPKLFRKLFRIDKLLK